MGSHMRDFVLSLPEEDDQPLFVRIAGAVVEAVRRGRLEPGRRLPSSRALASSLGVHRNTVLAAYAELFAQGWITGTAGKGTFVSQKLPEPARARPPASSAGMPATPHYPLAPFAGAPSVPPRLERGVLSMSGGVPDLRLLPAAEVARAYRRAVLSSRGAALDYGFERGHPRLRAALAAHLNAGRGLAATPEHVIVTRGSQMGFYLAARAIVQPGSVVAVEALGYPPAWSAFRAAGADVVPIRVDSGGLVVDDLRELAERRRIAAVYVTPHHQYPTMAVLAADRRLSLLELARRHRFAVVEDDYDNEIHYHGRPVLPLASADTAGSVIYVGTLSKVLAPGLRTGYVVAPRPLIERMAELRRSVDRQGDAAMEYAVAELLEDGILQRHARKMRRVYLARREALVALLHAHLPGVLTFEVPAGGLSLWARVEPAARVDVDAWQRAALARGVYFRPPAELAFDAKSRPFVRLSFAPLTEQELKTAVERLKASLPQVRRALSESVFGAGAPKTHEKKTRATPSPDGRTPDPVGRRRQRGRPVERGAR